MKTTMKACLIAILLTLIFSHASYSQQKVWEVDLKDALYEVGWILQSNDGLIIASGAKGLLAMDNNSGKIVWQNPELKAVDKNSFINIEGLPLFYCEYSPLAGKTRGIIINSSTGEIVFDTKDEGYRIKQFNLIREPGFVLFELMKGNEQLVMKFSLKTWKSEWVAKVGENKGLLGKAKGIMEATFITHGPLVTKDNKTLILGIKENIFAINIETGAVTWNKENDNDIKALVYCGINNSLYVGVRKSSKILVLDPTDGKDITPGKLKLRGTMLDVRADKNNNLILVETEGFNLIDPNTNNFLWKSSFKIEYLDEVIPHENGYIAVGKDEKEGSIALVDKQGKKIWDSKVKGYSYYATPTPKGVLYISTERSNILDYADGKDVWKKDVKFVSIPAVTYDEQEKKVVLFENKKAYKFDLNTGEMNLFAEGVQLEEVKKSTPLNAEYLKEGYYLYDQQHASLLSPKGEVKYTKYFEPVSSIGGIMGVAQLGLDIAGVDIDIEGSISNIKTLTDIANGAYQTSADQNDATSEESAIVGLYVGPSTNLTSVFEVTKKRYFNSKLSKEQQFMTVKVKEADNTKNFIYVLTKSTGAIDKKIELMDKTPNYVIDDVDKRVFVNEKNHIISCNQL
jgi:outer membrane protein assembly factor BamB